jgi:hypothetical protein
MIARAQGAVGIGPVKDLHALPGAIREAIEHVKKGEVCVVDVRVMPGYDANMSGAPGGARKS